MKRRREILPRKLAGGWGLPVALLIVVSCLALPARGAESVPGASALRPTIFIDGDSGFTAANGVVGGTGMPLDPYVIQGWEINASSTFRGGIDLRNTRSHVLIRNVTVYGSRIDFFDLAGGIHLSNASHVRIENATLYDNGNGINIDRGDDIRISTSNLSRNGVNVGIAGSTNLVVTGNALRAGFPGVPFSLTGSSDVVFRGNTVERGGITGITLSSSLRVSVIGNGEIPGGITLSGSSPSHYSSHTITPDNLVGGKPVRYYKDATGLVVDRISAGQILVANNKNVQLSNLTMSSGSPATAVAVAYSDGVLVTDSTIREYGEGIDVIASAHVTIRGNNVSSNGRGIVFRGVSNGAVVSNDVLRSEFGISVWSSPAVVIRGNRLVGTRIPYGYPAPRGTGIELVSSPNAMITDNYVSGRTTPDDGSRLEMGIRVASSDRVTLTGNVVGFTRGGIVLFDATNATVQRNTFQVDGLVVGGFFALPQARFFAHTVTEDNLVNGRPLRYYHDCSGLSLDGIIAGQVIVANCTDVRVAHLAINSTLAGLSLALVKRAEISSNDFSGNVNGISLRHSSNLTAVFNRLTRNDVGIDSWKADGLTLSRNTISENDRGIDLVGARNTTIVGNEIVRNHIGIWLSVAVSTTVYHNNFVNNSYHAVQEAQARMETNTVWDSGYPGGGNYWSDYSGADSCSGPNQTVCTGGDGIGDTPVIIPSNDRTLPGKDRYPLMKPYRWPATSASDSFVLIAGIAGTAIAVAAGIAVWWFRRKPPTELQGEPASLPEKS